MASVLPVGNIFLGKSAKDPRLHELNTANDILRSERASWLTFDDLRILGSNCAPLIDRDRKVAAFKYATLEPYPGL
ncbi:hypothetical protein SCAR479_10161 [Seiridium cardinale]|uniref:Uncharacterized protein n=1 Tax=Seiridium cardinale TaxID=138064 RepID=A0ABR2XHS6_9PEZI